MSESIKLPTVDLYHRITGQETEEFYLTDLSARGLAGAVDNMSDRASATTSLLQSYFECDSEKQPDDRTIYHALNSVLMELADIQKTVEAYAQLNRQA